MTFQTDTKHFVIKNLKISDNDFNRLPFGRQLDYLRGINIFKETAKQGYIGAKGIPFSKALKQWKTLYRPTEYYCVCRDKDGVWKDDSVEVWYKN